MVDVGRTQLTEPQPEALVTSGAFSGFGTNRRQALWTAGAIARDRPHYLPGTATQAMPPPFPA